MKWASATCAGSEACQSETYFAARNARRREGGQEAEAQRRQHRLGEGADIEDALTGVQAFQGFEGASAEAELAVIVVFDHCGTTPFRPGKQRDPPWQRHRHAQRELVGRGDVHQPGLVRDRVHDQAFGVDGYGNHACAQGLEQQPRRRVARFLDGHAVARLQQHASDEVDRLLRPVRDDDVVRVGLYGPGDFEVVGDRGA
jgi:hypothetical protein